VLAQVEVRGNELQETESRERQELSAERSGIAVVAVGLDLTGCTAIVVDDGIATGSTARAACEVARLHGASRIVFAAPIATAERHRATSLRSRRGRRPGDPTALLRHRPVLRRLLQTPDDEVVRLLEAAHKDGADPPVFDEEVQIASATELCSKGI
jgi:putative phosphoribosyl transferase